jgi:hypothetical protein
MYTHVSKCKSDLKKKKGSDSGRTPEYLAIGADYQKDYMIKRLRL